MWKKMPYYIKGAIVAFIIGLVLLLIHEAFFWLTLKDSLSITWHYAIGFFIIPAWLLACILIGLFIGAIIDMVVRKKFLVPTIIIVFILCLYISSSIFSIQSSAETEAKLEAQRLAIEESQKERHEESLAKAISACGDKTQDPVYQCIDANLNVVEEVRVDPNNKIGNKQDLFSQKCQSIRSVSNPLSWCLSEHDLRKDQFFIEELSQRVGSSTP